MILKKRIKERKNKRIKRDNDADNIMLTAHQSSPYIVWSGTKMIYCQKNYKIK